MAIHGATPVMLKAIDSLQLASVNPGSNQKLALHLGEGKEYSIHIGKSGDVSVQRDLAHLSTLGRIKNAVVDFFSRATTKGESALTTRATQIQSEVQRQLTELGQIKKIVQQAFNQPVSEFKNEAQYLKSGSDPKTATMADITDANKKRLGLERLDKDSLSFVQQHFSSFINGKDAIFSMLSSRVIERTISLHESLSGEALSSALNTLGHESEAFKAKVNAEFNRSFVQLFEQRANAELDALTKANTRANETSPLVEERTGSSDGENVAAKMKKSVRFNDNPVSDVRMFELEEGRALNIKV
ncbi:hypothetical protein L7P61_17285 [Aeromonas veronii bv. sobria]|uniref:Uncharacterized protein n=1 Tax=Aeromonas veronii TaxID=654 RepID=A0ABY3MJB9_AERVE|nr:hypothetical protein [Aeromonas veronii]RDU81494.1 hypothetical protein CGZ72_17155 [Aeromonas veronii]RDU81787.1 hypothetical protein CGZ76_17645 [Aeromonas veronii]TEY48028.1 hypothetical protein CIG14_16760 [Aeromonas veronii]TEY74798.1 hypothetical protein CIG16_17570 [Aeromonas veronii]TYD41907.1 hypothetical protein CJF23_15695 [Aeromonas veronii]